MNATEELKLEPSVDAPAVPKRHLLEDQAREKAGMPENWNLHTMEAFPKTGRDFIYTEVTGAVCTAVFAKGPRKGQKNWECLDPATERVVIITREEELAWLTNWERTHDACHECHGTSQQRWGWSVTEGTRYRLCGRCKGTGKPKQEAP